MSTLSATSARAIGVGGKAIGALSIVLALAMIAGGALKLVNQTTQVEAFAAVGLPAWFRALVGTFEVIGGILIATPATRPIGSLILATILVGAAWTHVANAQWGPLVVVLALLSLFLTVFWHERSRAIQLLGRA